MALRLLNADEAVIEAVRSGELGQLGEESEGEERSLAPEDVRTQVVDTARRLRWELPTDFHDRISERLYAAAEQIADKAQMRGLKKASFDVDRHLDALLTSRWLGFPLMLAILAAVFWITIEGANVPSGMLATLLIDTAHP